RRGPEEPAEDLDYPDDRTRGAGGGRAQQALNRGAVHLLISAILFTVMGVVNIILDFIIAGMIPYVPNSAYMAGVCFGLIIRLALVATTAVFLFIGSSMLRRARGRGLVLTGCILGIVLAGLCTVGLLVQVINLTRIDRLFGSRAGTVVALSVLG